MKDTLYPHAKSYKNVEDLKADVMQILKNIPQQHLFSAINKFPEKIRKVISVNGLPAKN